MELPQSSPYGTTQARKATHDFLSLYSHSSIPQDTRPPHGGLLKTHNFLQPLEREDKNTSKEDNSVDLNIEKPPPSAPGTIEHLLPRGIGTYSISHVSYFNPRVPKPEENVFTVAPTASNDRNDDISNCSSYTGSGFTLWDESAVRKGNSGKENSGDVNVVKESTSKVGQWPLDRPSQSSSNHRSSISPFSSSQTLSQKNQSFMEMIKSAKGPHFIDEDEDDVTLKKESSSSQKGELSVKVDGKSNDQKPNTPRSKHSATEQRRRCKINDRFQMLRGIIPHGDQKRDKASFLLEVIEYIQFLQEKINRYEGSYPGVNSEPPKLASWRNNHGPTEGLLDQSRVINGIVSPVLMFGTKLDEKASAVPLNIPRTPQIPVESNVINAINFKTIDQQSGMVNKAVPISSTLVPDIYTPIRNSCPMIQTPARVQPDKDNASRPQLGVWQNNMTPSEHPAAADKLKSQGLAFEGGTIGISSAYSQGLLSTLTRALQNSGVDLSQASISVQVDIGKRANNNQNKREPFDKVTEAPSRSQSLVHSRVESGNAESDHAIKRLKTG